MIRSILNSPLGLAVDDFAHEMVDLARAARARIIPASRREHAAKRLRRANSDQCVADFSRAGGPAMDIHIEGAVVVDGMWDNAAHWLRYAMVRRALGLWRHEEIGLTGRHSASQVKDTFRRFGIDRIVRFLPSPYPLRRNKAKASIKTAKPFLGTSLPTERICGVPPAMSLWSEPKRSKSIP